MNSIILLACSSLTIIFCLFLIHVLVSGIIINTKYKKTFNNIYKNISPTPKYKMQSSYGYPSFTITFDSTKTLINAEEAGLNHKFMEEIQELCKDIGSKDNPFNAEIAVFFATNEYWKNLENQFKKKSN